MCDTVAGDFETFQINDIARRIQRPVNCLSERSKNIRIKALEDIYQVVTKECNSAESLEFLLTRSFENSLIKVISDPVEKCRHLVILIYMELFQKVGNTEHLLKQILPTLSKRLGQQELIEPSEEIRLQLIHLLKLIIDVCQKKIIPYIDDFIKILQHTLVDNYPEVRKCSCECVSQVAKTIPQQFYFHSETLINPLLLTLTHQHSKVRVLTVQTIGVVLQHGNGKSVDDVVSHLAQRLFDSVPSVRLATIKTVGEWLLDLPDRYSYHPKLIPLILSGLVDDAKEVQDEAECLWHDIGIKYKLENEAELKEKMDFMEPPPKHYPNQIKRPNLGCRQLVYHHYSKILPAVIRDMADWNTATRTKASQLLYLLLINEEDNVTQHLDKTLEGLYKSCCDEEPGVVKFVLMSSELLGYFVDVDVWCKMILQNIKLSQSHGSLFILANVIRGSQRLQLETHLNEILDVLSDPGICQIAESKIQDGLLACIESILTVVDDGCRSAAGRVYLLLMFVASLHTFDETKLKAKCLIEKLAIVEEMSSTDDLVKKHARTVLDFLEPQSSEWLNSSPQLFVFETFIQFSGGHNLECCMEEILNIFAVNLIPSKCADVRHRLFALLSHLITSSPSTFRSTDLILRVLKDMLLPNCVWTAGRTSEVMRKSAISCFWKALDLHLLSREQMLELGSWNTVSQVRTLLDDENRVTRLITCDVLSKIFDLVGDSLEKNSDLYNLYLDLLKRLDDGNDDVRIAASRTFSCYLSCLQPGFNVSLYSAHLEEIFKGLLIHLDDPNQKIQDSILDTLVKASCLTPDMLLKLASSVRLKHRSPKYCDILIQHIHSLPKPL